MIITTCAACAAPLAHDAPRCVRCKTRYCNSTCQHDHWRRGHKQICEKIHRGGNAEQYLADNKYKEAVAEAVEACADDTKGQTCYICLEAVHSRTGEGLVRGCACGDRDGVSSPELGVAHVSCLARQAKILREEAEDNNLGVEARDARWALWSACSLCEQQYHGVVACALGWACWRTYLGRPEGDAARSMAMSLFGKGLYISKHFEGALCVQEARLSLMRRVGAPGETMLAVQSNLASTYEMAGQKEQALRMQREVYSKRVMLNGEEHLETLRAASNYAGQLQGLKHFEEAKSMLRKIMPVARRVLGEGYDLTLKSATNYTRVRSTRPTALHSKISARPWRRSRTWYRPCGVCLATRTRSQRILGHPSETREQQCAPASRRVRRRKHTHVKTGLTTTHRRNRGPFSPASRIFRT